jgi:hypothetical protein
MEIDGDGLSDARAVGKAELKSESDVDCQSNPPAFRPNINVLIVLKY